jgi:hypothetical protein
MKSIRIFVPAILGLLSLTIANGVRAEITINPADNGNFSVTGMIPGNGCTVLFNPRGAVVQQGSSCSQKEIRKAQDAMDAYLREQNASDDDENRRGGNYADSDAGGPDFWEITGVPNNDLGLKTEPSLNSSFRVKGLHNGTVLRNLGCENHGGDRWCRVEVRDNPSQNGWARMQYLRESGGSSHHNGSHHNSSIIRGHYNLEWQKSSVQVAMVSICLAPPILKIDLMPLACVTELPCGFSPVRQRVGVEWSYKMVLK